MRKVFSRFSVYKTIIWGHFLLAVMGVIYCIAWSLDFSHEGFMDLWYAKILYYISITGTCIGFLFVVEATRLMIMDLRQKLIKVWYFALIALIVYTIGFILTTPWYKRIYTAELLLVALWIILQPAVILACYYHGWINKTVTKASMILIAIGIVLGLIFYNYY